MIKKMKTRTVMMVFILCIAVLVAFFNLFNTKQVVAAKVNPYQVLVDVEVSKLYVLKDGKVYQEYTCSGGKPSTPSPIGTWKIVSKGKWGEGFGGSWMRI